MTLTLISTPSLTLMITLTLKRSFLRNYSCQGHSHWHWLTLTLRITQADIHTDTQNFTDTHAETFAHAHWHPFILTLTYWKIALTLWLYIYTQSYPQNDTYTDTLILTQTSWVFSRVLYKAFGMMEIIIYSFVIYRGTLKKMVTLLVRFWNMYY